LLAFAARRGHTAWFCLAWFAIAIAPVLPLRDHVTEYYSFLPAIGLCWLGGWALAAAWPTHLRYASVGLAMLYVLIMVPRTVAASDFSYRLSIRVRDLVEGVARAHELHPGRTILLDGVDTDLFYHGMLDHPFRAGGLGTVLLTPASALHIQAHPELGDVSEFVMPADDIAKGIGNDAIAVYDVRGPKLRNITSTYASQARDAGVPRRVDVGSPLAASLLGPEWYAAEANHRWMPKRASLRIGGPTAAGQSLYLRGFYPAEQFGKAPLLVQVTANGTALPGGMLAGGGDFKMAFPLPASLVGQAAIEITVEVSRTFRAGSDIRDLGLAFGEFEVR
jgi:hypothetical protein